MKFALLGADPDSLQLAEAAVAAGYSVVVGDLNGAGPADLVVPLDQTARWAELAGDETIDAFILGQGTVAEDARVQLIQELARLDRPCLATHPIVSSVLAYFQIDMVRTENSALLQHFNPLAMQAELMQAAAWTASGHPRFGRVEQIVCTRTLADRSRERVLWHFARDVELLDAVGGRLDRVGAHAGVSQEAADYSALSVQLLGAAETPVRWSVEPPDGAEGMVLAFICQRGRVTLAFDALGSRVDAGGETGPLADACSHAATAAAALQRFAAAIESSAPAHSTWPSALHAMELADSIEISLRRGRMVDVYQQQLTESLAFRGTMAAVGCGVLAVLIPLMLLVGWIAGLMGVPVAEYWPHALLALLTVFLALQLLPNLLFQGSGTAPPGGTTPR
ncbi:MAG: hypothetical protein DCC67_05160 [Planctomycetota bacterium]|nr:MAG: hypothetical protein DCC67_05160 [Planctomycetota bacterium]